MAPGPKESGGPWSFTCKCQLRALLTVFSCRSDPFLTLSRSFYLPAHNSVHVKVWCPSQAPKRQKREETKRRRAETTRWTWFMGEELKKASAREKWGAWVPLYSFMNSSAWVFVRMNGGWSSWGVGTWAPLKGNGAAVGQPENRSDEGMKTFAESAALMLNLAHLSTNDLEMSDEDGKQRRSQKTWCFCWDGPTLLRVYPIGV